MRTVFVAVLAAAGTLLSTAAEASPQPTITSGVVAEGLAYQRFTWGELRVGDCHQINGTLTFYSDGTGYWSARTWTDSTHSGDIWHTRFQIVAGAGAGEFFVPTPPKPHDFPTFDSPRMDDDGQRYDWGQPFTYDKLYFNSAREVYQRYSC
ncbi:DUF6294 family protein [Amycolatopsis sp. NPDC059657]|uniref:DUF6294 family protein n=1 Tax=Amycolatopsis sp. NPDC059657 TaxID=3346899 RepID=UPI00366E7C7E